MWKREKRLRHSTLTVSRNWNSNLTNSSISAQTSNSSQTVDQCWLRLKDFTHKTIGQHQQLQSFLRAVLNPPEQTPRKQSFDEKPLKEQKTYIGVKDLKKDYESLLENQKKEVKHITKKYQDLLKESVLKSKQIYYKKAEQLEQEQLENAQSQKILKMTKDASACEHAYRLSVVNLELARYKMLDLKNKILRDGESKEMTRINCMNLFLHDLVKLETRVSEMHQKEASGLQVFVDCIKPDVDCNLWKIECQNALQIPEKVYFEHYKNKTPAKNMSYGIQLTHCIMGTGQNIPIILQKLVKAIEERGLTREGIYRVSGRVSEVQELKLRLETDADAVDLMDEAVDINCVAALVKLYFRELPNPLFLMAPKTRQEYSSIPDQEERIRKLRNYIRGIPKENQHLLKYLVLHLQKVAAHASENKMPITNLALLFGPVIFQGEADAIPEPHQNWFSKQEKTMVQYDYLKTDLVVDDLFTYGESLWSELNLSGSTTSLGTKMASATSLSELVAESGPPLPVRRFISQAPPTLDQQEKTFTPSAIFASSPSHLVSDTPSTANAETPLTALSLQLPPSEPSSRESSQYSLLNDPEIASVMSKTL
ncbi:hypothetical protein EDD86DRAFT_198113 [Gorgonomyces haynaldii]|nr:hypothetical protein EDD86DRAFT_198113 [Gorgonomyces haynaldii]